METILPTLLVAFIVVLIALALLGIGFLITGKVKIKPGCCGKNPHQKKENDKECGGDQSSCDLCKKPSDEKSDL